MNQSDNNLSTPTPKSIENAKIFLIDDEPAVLDVYKIYLSDVGFTQIYSFTDSVEAIETLRFLTPNIILTDISMPEVSGTFLIKLIRTYDHLRTVPIVAVTANTDSDIEDSIMRKGADSVIHKPVDPKTLTNQVSQTLKSSFKLESQLTEALQRETIQIEKKKAQMITFESDLRNMMRYSAEASIES